MRSIQIRTGYNAGKWSGYGYIGVIEHGNEEPKAVPIRNTKTRTKLYRSRKLFMGKMVKSEGRRELDLVKEEFPNIPVFQ